VRYRQEWLPRADWFELEAVGHCPQHDVPLETAQLILGFAVGFVTALLGGAHTEADRVRVIARSDARRVQ
jgi:hypothetical protein